MSCSGWVFAVFLCVWTWPTASFKTVSIEIDFYARSRVFKMSRLTQIIIAVVALAIIGGGIFLMTWDIPAPSEKVTKTLNNDRFPS